MTLERLLLMKERMGFPTWFWKEIVIRTDLRLAVQKGDWLNDWENLSRDDIVERQQTKDFRWQTVLNEWKQDITAWRQKHYSDLSLVVTRLVCNELSEHIHHTRGIKPAFGLTGKPVWYKNLMGSSGLPLPPAKPIKPEKPGMAKIKASLKKNKPQPAVPSGPIDDSPEGEAYFGRGLNRTYFKPGASILSLGWTSDIMLVLLAIVLTTATFVAQGKIPVDLAEARSGEPLPPSETVEIVIDEAGSLFIDGVATSTDELPGRLDALTPATPVLLRVDRTSQFGHFVQVIDELKARRLENLSIVTRRADG